MNAIKELERFDKECEEFKGDKALFWAGRMSMYIMQLNNIPRLSETIYLLKEMAKRYDEIIFGRTK